MSTIEEALNGERKQHNIELAEWREAYEKLEKQGAHLYEVANVARFENTMLLESHEQLKNQVARQARELALLLSDQGDKIELIENLEKLMEKTNFVRKLNLQARQDMEDRLKGEIENLREALAYLQTPEDEKIERIKHLEGVEIELTEQLSDMEEKLDHTEMRLEEALDDLSHGGMI